MTASETKLFHRLQLTAHQLQKQADRKISSETRLTTAQAAVLRVLKERDGASQGEIAEALGLNSSALTAMTARLRALGYMRRERDPSDGRAWRMRISEAGEEALIAAQRPFTHVNSMIEATLNESEIEQLADMLERLSSAFSTDRRIED